MYETLKSLFELLFQGTIAGLIVVLVTRYLENRKAKELAQKHAMLVVLEIKEHLISLERIEAAGEISVFSAPVRFADETWTASSEYLTVLPMEDLLRLAAYYHSVMKLNIFLDNYPGPLTPPVKQSFDMNLLMCRAMIALLDRSWDCKNSKTHDALYRKHFAQAAAYQQHQQRS